MTPFAGIGATIDVPAGLHVDGVRALGLDYTDGVRSIATWFVAVEPGHVHEVTCMAYHAATGAPLMDCVAAGRAFAAGIQWTRPRT